MINETGSQDSTCEALLRLLERNVRLGHYKLALRHFQMLEQRGADIPPHLGAYCAQARNRCSTRELAAIKSAVTAWARMCSPRSRWWLDVDACIH